MPINLTNPNRQRNPQPKPRQFFASTDDKGKPTIKPKFSKVFQDAGQDFVRSYEVIRLSYWLKYELIGHGECALYDTLHLFCKKQIEFTLEYLAKALNVGDETLRQMLDNLENAELLEVIKVNDELGQRNDYIIKSPFYERETFTERKKLRILEKKEDLPETFLETQVERLRRQIRKNSVKRVRKILRNKNLKGFAADIKRRAQTAIDERRFLWKRLVRTFGANAVKFDTIVYETIQLEFLQSLSGNDYQTNFIRILRKRLEENKIGWSSWITDIADQLRAFYELRIKVKPSDNGTTADDRRAADIPPTNHSVESELLNKIIAAKGDTNPNDWTKPQIKSVLQVLRESAAIHGLSLVERIAAEALPDFILQKLSVEMRT